MRHTFSLFKLFLLISLAFSFIPKCFAISDDIVLWLRFDEGSGGIAKDSSNYGNNGEINGAEWVNGIFGSALYFNGSSYVEVKSTDELQLSKEGLTIACWFKTTEKTGHDLMFVEKGAWDSGEYALSYPGHANFRVRFQINEIHGIKTDQIDSVSGAPELSDDEWHHAAGVYDAVNQLFKVYVNGELETEQGSAPHKFTPDNQSVFLGTRNLAGNWYIGAIDELLIAKVPFNDEMIIKHMTAQLAPVSPEGRLATEWGYIKKTD